MDKGLSGKHNQKPLHCATDALKTASKSPIQKTEEATDNLIGNKIVNKILGTASQSFSGVPSKTKNLEILKDIEFDTGK